VLVHETALLADPFARFQAVSDGAEGTNAELLAREGGTGGGLRAYRCTADGFVGSYEEVLRHTQQQAQSEGDGLPVWWARLDYGASNQRKAAVRAIVRKGDGLPVWWARLDYGASNQRKAAVRAARNAYSKTGAGAARRAAMSATLTKRGGANFDASKRYTLYEAPDDVSAHENKFGLSFNAGVGSPSLERLAALEQQLFRTQQTLDTLLKLLQGTEAGAVVAAAAAAVSNGSGSSRGGGSNGGSSGGGVARGSPGARHPAPGGGSLADRVVGSL
jgi:hypothetical protein